MCRSRCLLCVCVFLPCLSAPLQAWVCLQRHLHVFQLLNLKSFVLLLASQHRRKLGTCSTSSSFPIRSPAPFASYLALLVLFTFVIAWRRFAPSHTVSSLFWLFSLLTPFISLLFVLIHIFCISAEDMLFNLVWKRHYNHQQRGDSLVMNWMPWHKVKCCMQVSVYVLYACITNTNTHICA